MTRLRFALAASVLLLPGVCLGQSTGPRAMPSDADRSFEAMKSLAGNWRGPVTVDVAAWATDKPLNISMHVASSGKALVHELMQKSGIPEVSVFYVEGDRLTTIHFCDYGNQSRMVARPSGDGKPVDFELVQMTGENKVGHITRGVFTIADADHHVEEWTFQTPDGRSVHARMDLTRVK